MLVAVVFFGISFQVTLIDVVLVPLVALIIWLQSRRGSFSGAPHPSPSPPAERGRRNALSPAASRFVRSVLIFAAGLVVTFLAITFAMGAEGYWLQLKQSWAAHFASTKSFEYGSPNDHPFEWSILLKNWDATVPAMLGIIVCLLRVRKDALLIIPVAWFALTLVVFGTHKPWWSYYYIHSAVPLCWCAAIGVAAVVEQWARGGARSPGRAVGIAAAGVCGLFMAGWVGGGGFLEISQNWGLPPIFSSLGVEEWERYKRFS